MLEPLSLATGTVLQISCTAPSPTCRVARSITMVTTSTSAGVSNEGKASSASVSQVKIAVLNHNLQSNIDSIILPFSSA